MPITVLDHPLAAHYLTLLRDKSTEPAKFRTLTKKLTLLLIVEATRGLTTVPATVETPMEAYSGRKLGGGLIAVPILRAGLGMLDPLLELFPDVSVGYIGLERDHATAVAASYYAKLPPKIGGRTTLVLDPMLATGGSASNAIARIKEAGAGPILMLSIVAAPEGVARLNEDHPDVAVFSAGLDRELNDRKYILPGLGDFGDRLYGTEPID
ncbi:uracil phosphoribosyltransferase [Capsulimonas corticalis]|uniref:Uracil phosphoribosyltransferase n=1 Tax=Capsulimonas corticalis TaxID=2219043 RepID=A0A402D3J1_9BACT|nr:uracil phosphoribosyltransferase [Capsulimonas corticalis]BDI31846.1 uracil phosphoribosyltransferase [Capsulimonas corticalis]